MMKRYFAFLLLALVGVAVDGFVPTSPRPTILTSALFAETAASTDDAAIADDDEIIGRRIVVKGDVNGGYYRSCVLNEVSFSILHSLASFLFFVRPSTCC